MQPYTYLLVDLGCIIVPFIFSFHPLLNFHKEWKYMIPGYIVTALFFIVWDMIFTHIGIWWFRADYLMGINIINVPIEEILFFICIPYACSFTYHSLKVIAKMFSYKNPFQKINQGIHIFLILISLMMVVIGWDKAYTFYTGLFNLLFLSYIFIKKIDISFIFLSYLAVIPFFLLSNGILTGSFLDAPVVNYNNTENLGIRMFTIPIEDTMYGFLFICATLVCYEYYKHKTLNSKIS